ncbi:antibiotic biosynthesis monooxygenase [Zavarzinia compransoris]|uniref:putative quinol monooxygenase n=1 Tax=Zavarzinia marina TaxID=2911065 RepID=UPI001F3BA581|nr:putative quinol monooxygenase [Zavarzinia marina]MCF4165626.1 antibiotic biosynthesis monooxygenase [Zavarzinia marina]
MIIVEGSIRVADLAAARPHMEAMIRASRAEAGCLDYAYAVDLLDPGLIRVSERWESRAALALHLKSEHIAAWRAAWPAIGVTDRVLRLYEAEPEVF